MANPKTVEEALKTAPVGAQWFRAGSKDGKTPAFNLRKTKDGQFIFFASGQASYKATAAEAATFFRSKNLTNCNMPQYMPTTVNKPKPASKPKTPAPGAKKKEEKPKEEPEEEVDKQFDDTDILTARAMQTAFDQANFGGLVTDWRVRLALAPGAEYLYAGDNPGILQPLAATNGVVFPYTPNISVSYAANYEPVNIVHSNYKVFQYNSSSVDQVSITCDFTAQDTYEARYLLAVIHFFRTMTKMFYGQDQYPVRGTPPPLCYLFGLGAYQFSAHPMAINGFTYNLPQDVDYIQTMAPTVAGAPSTLESITKTDVVEQQKQDRLGTQCSVGGILPRTQYNTVPRDIATWVPTKISLSISCLPIMSRNQTSNYFSLNEYGSGRLIKGQSRPGGGMW